MTQEDFAHLGRVLDIIDEDGSENRSALVRSATSCARAVGSPKSRRCGGNTSTSKRLSSIFPTRRRAREAFPSPRPPSASSPVSPSVRTIPGSSLAGDSTGRHPRSLALFCNKQLFTSRLNSYNILFRRIYLVLSASSLIDRIGFRNHTGTGFNAIRDVTCHVNRMISPNIRFAGKRPATPWNRPSSGWGRSTLPTGPCHGGRSLPPPVREQASAEDRGVFSG